MLLPRMHAAIRNQPEQMQLAPAQASVLHRLDQHRMREEFAVLDHQIDARDIHVHDAPRANIQMPDFAIPICPSGSPTNGPLV